MVEAQRVKVFRDWFQAIKIIRHIPHFFPPISFSLLDAKSLGLCEQRKNSFFFLLLKIGILVLQFAPDHNRLAPNRNSSSYGLQDLNLVLAGVAAVS